MISKCFYSTSVIVLICIASAVAEKPDEKCKIKVGEVAPSFFSLDGAGDAQFIEYYKGKVVLLNYWSLNDKASLRLQEDLKKILREFGDRKDFLILSVCIDKDWDEWNEYYNRQMKSDDRMGPGRSNSGSKWYQMTEAGIGDYVPSKEAFGAITPPASFLIGPDNRFLAVRIPPEKLRKAVVAALGTKSADNPKSPG